MNKIGKWFWEDKNTTESTNDDAFLLSKEAKQDFFIISAKEQTKGRGRRGRQWISLAGNLFFSQGFKANLKELGQLVCLSSLSLYEVIKETLPSQYQVNLKWPNDVLIDNNKVSGMLLEKGENNYLIIGIGVNICEAPQSAELLYPVTSLKAKGINIDRLTFLRSYINKFDNNYEIWQKSGFSPIKTSWLNAVKGINDKVCVHTASEKIQGIFTGIGDNGELLLQTEKEKQKIYAGDVFYIEKEK